MNYFDFALLGLLFVFIAIGAWRGFVREILSLTTWGAAIAVAWLFAGDLAGLFQGLFDDPTVQQILAFVLIFSVVFLTGTLVNLLVHRFLLPKKTFRVGNLVLGGFVGAARGALVVTIVFLVAGVTSFPQRDWWRAAALAPYFERTALFASQFIPRDIARHIRYG